MQGSDDVEEVVLAGGVANAGAVVRLGDEVRRPLSPSHPSIHALLAHVRAAGFDGVPEVLGVDEQGRERLRWIPGEVACVPFPAWSQTDVALASVARLLRRFHDATGGFVSEGRWSDELADPHGASAEVICHNDVCPENVVFRDGEAVALLDFDFASPGRRVHDLAAFARMWVPVETDEDAARTGRGGLDPFRRLRVVADAYGLGAGGSERADFLAALEHQIRHGGAFVRRRIAAGETAFVEMWERLGGEARIERRAHWFARHRRRFADALSP